MHKITKPKAYTENQTTDTQGHSKEEMILRAESMADIDESLASKGIIFLEGEEEFPGITINTKKRIIDIVTNGIKEIYLYINSGGGSSDMFLSLHDLIHNIRKAYNCKVYIIVNGIAASGAALVLQAADVRMATKNSFIMIHETSFDFGGKTADFQDYFKVIGKVQNKVFKIWAEKMGISQKELYEILKKKDVYFTASEAKKMGLIDMVV
jgi:ATP-dependent Clp protease protease subunit